MRLSKGSPACWRGAYSKDRVYQAGELVTNRYFEVYISRFDGNSIEPVLHEVADQISHRDAAPWVYLGRFGASPRQVLHSWHPKELQYPSGDQGEMSEVATVCQDCWKDADFKNAFNAMAHLYVIREQIVEY